MTDLQHYINARNLGVDLVAQCVDLGEGDLINLGMDPNDAAELAQLAHVFFGATSFAGRQRRAVEAARRMRHSMAVIQRIEHFVAKVKTETQGWKLREQLCKTPALEIDRVAREFIKALKPKNEPEESMRITRRKNKPWTLSLTGDSSTLAELAAALDKDSPMESVNALLKGNGNARTQVATNVIITLDQLDEVLRRTAMCSCEGSGGDAPFAGECTCNCDDIELRLTNGATMTGTQLVQKVLAEHGFVTVVHPVEGPLNLYRTTRFANTKQRIILAAENPTCAWPGCSKPADECQFHHIEAWKFGGETNIENLVTLCAYHNAVNDDDALGPPKRGRMVRVDGRTGWQPPWSGPPQFEDD